MNACTREIGFERDVSHFRLPISSPVFRQSLTDVDFHPSGTWTLSMHVEIPKWNIRNHFLTLRSFVPRDPYLISFRFLWILLEFRNRMLLVFLFMPLMMFHQSTIIISNNSSLIVKYVIFVFSHTLHMHSLSNFVQRYQRTFEINNCK